MNWKVLWQLSTRIDKWAHLAGCFTITTVAMRFLDLPAAVIWLASGSLALEIYQHLFEPDYPTKRADTALDLIADGVGIAGAVVIQL